jgi:DUF1009 family protein
MLDNNLQAIAIFAGRGQLPKILIEDCLKKNRHFILFLLKNEIYDEDYSNHNPTVIAYGEIERFLTILRDKNIRNIVFIGGVTKPNFSALKVDKKGAILLTKIIANKILGDDAVLKTVIKFFEKEGLKILKIDDLLDCVFSSKGLISKIVPGYENNLDIELGIKAIKHFSKFDVGQALIVAQKQIIAIEALEGTDAMISRLQTLRGDFKNNAVLIKLKKPHQSDKADLPTIGLTTIAKCAEVGIKGLVIQANSTLVLDKERLIEAVNDNKLFLKVV